MSTSLDAVSEYWGQYKQPICHHVHYRTEKERIYCVQWQLYQDAHAERCREVEDLKNQLYELQPKLVRS